jgi:hypothetical protein
MDIKECLHVCFKVLKIASVPISPDFKLAIFINTSKAILKLLQPPCVGLLRWDES